MKPEGLDADSTRVAELAHQDEDGLERVFNLNDFEPLARAAMERGT